MFLIMGDEKYSHTIEVSIRRILAIYEDAPILLFDWGLAVDSKEAIQALSDSVVIKQVDVRRAKTRQDWLFLFRMGMQYKMHLLKHMLYRLLLGRSVPSRLQFEFMILQKISCFEMACDYFSGSFVFLDADAILNGRLDELFEDDIDIGVTQRRRQEISYVWNDCRALNSGVIYFGHNQFVRKAFVARWKSMAYETREKIAEQTSLTRYLQEYGLDQADFYDELTVNTLGAGSAKVRILPCERYNFNWIDEVVMEPAKADRIKILHFKGGRHDRDNFSKLVSRIPLSEVSGNSKGDGRGR